MLRAGGLAERVAAHGVLDGGDLALPAPDGSRGRSGLLNESALSSLVTAVRQGVTEAHRNRRIPLLVGGDCPVLLGALAAIAAAGDEPGLIMVDGHEDAWPPAHSPTGEGSDSEIAIALGAVANLPPPLARSVPLLEAEALAFLGPRDRAEIDRAGIESLAPRAAFFADAGALERGREAARRHAREALATLDASAFWLHIDLDVLSTQAFAAVDYPQPGGIGWPELDEIAAAAAADPRCRGTSVVIYNPDLDPNREGARAVIAFLGRLTRAAP